MYGERIVGFSENYIKHENTVQRESPEILKSINE